jgi:hypothetical protein
MMLLAAVTWWFLVDVYGTQHGIGDGPRAKGPFPSKELCRVAGASMFPSDSRFWTPKQVRVAEEEARVYSLRVNSEIIAKRKPGTKQTIELFNGTSVMFNEKDEFVGLVSGFGGGGSSGGMVSCPCYMALTPCTATEFEQDQP